MIDPNSIPGVWLDMPAREYHADPVPGGSLRASMAATLIEKSPLHALHHTFDLCIEPPSIPTIEMSIGTAAHAMILEKVDLVEIIDAPDFKTKDARRKRDEALSAGKVPLLDRDYSQVSAIDRNFWLQLPLVMGDEFRKADKEAVFIWEEAGMRCRSRLDALNIKQSIIFDLKTTAGSAHPYVWSKSHMWPGAAVQAAFYTRGVKAVTGIDCDYRLLVIEQNPPYALSVIGLDSTAAAVASQMADVAIRTWRECRSSGRYPGYGTGIHWAEAPHGRSRNGREAMTARFLFSTPNDGGGPTPSR